MKEPAYGPTEILRLANGGVTIVTKSWWKKFLAMQEKSLTGTSTSHVPSSNRGSSAHEQVVQ